ncbi:MAG: DNA polymerase III subunit delta' [Cocleimonas sp.]|nr:DNA polymerase III subunit delta' [Cocleimonas sp.]
MMYTWHQKVWDQLVVTRHAEHLPHALLLSGAKGIGKKGFAEALINSLLCESPRERYHPCGQCKSCQVKYSGAHPDYHRVTVADDKKQIVVDQIRQLNEFLHMSRSYNGYRVAFIHPVELLNINAANSLLKSLEEPADNSIIILLTSQPSTLLATLKSRCQMLYLPTPNKQDALQWLSQQAIQHKPNLLLAMSGGRPLYALDLDNDEYFNSRNEFANDLSAVINHQQAITDISKKWQKASKQELLDWQLNWVQQIIKDHFSKTQNKPILVLPKPIDIHHLWILHDQLIRFREIAHTSLNAQLFIESMLLSWMKLR